MSRVQGDIVSPGIPPVFPPQCHIDLTHEDEQPATRGAIDLSEADTEPGTGGLTWGATSNFEERSPDLVPEESDFNFN